MATITALRSDDFDNSDDAYQALATRYRSDYSHNFGRLSSLVHMNHTSHSLFKSVTGNFARDMRFLLSTLG